MFQELEEKMKEVEEVTGNDENVKRLAAKLDHLRRNVTKAKGTGDIICENVRFGKKYIVFVQLLLELLQRKMKMVTSSIVEYLVPRQSSINKSR